MEINPPKEITRGFKKPLWSVRSSQMYQLMMDLRALESVETCYPFGQYHHVVFKEDVQEPDKAKAAMSGIDLSDIEVTRIEATIEDCFMELMRQ